MTSRRALGVAACCLAACAENTSVAFQLLVGDTPIEIAAPTAILVQVVVVGADEDEVTLDSPNLPSFVTLNGLTMRLAPTYQDDGDYTVDLVATTATEMATGSMTLHITRPYTPSLMHDEPWVDDGSSTQTPYAHLYVRACDEEQDSFRFEIDVASQALSLDAVSDYTVNVDFAVTPPLEEITYNSCVMIDVPFPGLAPGTYRSAVQLVGAFGENPYGWYEVHRQFTVTP